MDTKKAFSVAEAAKRSGLGRSTLYALWKRGEGPARIKAGKRTLIRDEALNLWLQQLEGQRNA